MCVCMCVRVCVYTCACVRKHVLFVACACTCGQRKQPLCRLDAVGRTPQARQDGMSADGRVNFLGCFSEAAAECAVVEPAAA